MGWNTGPYPWRRPCLLLQPEEDGVEEFWAFDAGFLRWALKPSVSNGLLWAFSSAAHLRAHIYPASETCRPFHSVAVLLSGGGEASARLPDLPRRGGSLRSGADRRRGGEMSYMRGDLLTKMRKMVKGLARPEPRWLKAMEESVHTSLSFPVPSCAFALAFLG